LRLVSQQVTVSQQVAIAQQNAVTKQNTLVHFRSPSSLLIFSGYYSSLRLYLLQWPCRKIGDPRRHLPANKFKQLAASPRRHQSRGECVAASHSPTRAFSLIVVGGLDEV
jgi:hypothetical protein